jgi:Na+-transporting methylmalonyl-CoA/oxaloacetate decarboxylase gamma subunit
MLFLYLLLVLSLAVLLWVIWAMATHVRRHGEDEQRSPETEELESTGHDEQPHHEALQVDATERNHATNGARHDGIHP